VSLNLRSASDLVKGAGKIKLAPCLGAGDAYGLESGERNQGQLKPKRLIGQAGTGPTTLSIGIGGLICFFNGCLGNRAPRPTIAPL
jgi:hypothetical protein